MSVASPSFSQIRAQVAAIRKKLPQARTIGIRSTGRWTGESLNQDGDETYFVQQCDSPLALRVALRTAVDEQTTRVLLTPLDDADLSDDIRVRLAKRSLFQIDAWQIVRTLFQAHAVDPRVTKHAWLADALLEAIPQSEYPAARGGFLDQDTVWPLLLGQKLGLAADAADLPGLFRWATDPKALGAWRQLPEQFRQAAADWLADKAGPVARLVLSVMAGWSRPDAVPLGLAAGVLFAAETKGKLEKAVGRLEAAYLGNVTPPADLMQHWALASTEVVRAIRHSDADLARQLLKRGDELLQEVGAIEFAHVSNTSPAGFETRLSRFGQRLGEMLQQQAWNSGGSLTEARDAVRAHDAGPRDSRRLERVEMALRLSRWLAANARSETAPQSLSQAAEYHLTEGGYVDWARLTLRAGDSQGPLSAAYAQLVAAVTDIRERQAERFGRLLADWTAAGSKGTELVPVERILSEIVAPLAADRPVLVVVIDGMSVAVACELVTDLQQKEWLPLAEPGHTRNRAGLATLPSVTEFSRTSLLCGQLQAGTADIERAGFAEHPALLKHCRTTNPPILFHKAALQKADDAGLAKDVREAIQSSHRQVVGVVVNAVDDFLAKGDQLDFKWSADKLHILPALLHEARTAGRVVVLLSDHGHILDVQAQGRTSEPDTGNGGARWRSPSGPFHSDEYQVQGSRVLVPGHKLVAPWSERIRYGGKQNGYHGGLSPQEMVVPVVVLSSTDKLPDGWQLKPVDLPVWWEESLAAAPVVAAPTPRLKPQKPLPTGKLFDLEVEAAPETTPVDEPTRSAWIPELLKSPVYEQQKALAARGLRDPAMVERFLQTMDERGGKITTIALARVLSLPEYRISGMVSQLGRLLNVDGYQVVSLDSDSATVELNRELLLRQFDLVEE